MYTAPPPASAYSLCLKTGFLYRMSEKCTARGGIGRLAAKELGHHKNQLPVLQLQTVFCHSKFQITVGVHAAVDAKTSVQSREGLFTEIPVCIFTLPFLSADNLPARKNPRRPAIPSSSSSSRLTVPESPDTLCSRHHRQSAWTPPDPSQRKTAAQNSGKVSPFILISGPVTLVSPVPPRSRS